MLSVDQVKHDVDALLKDFGARHMMQAAVQSAGYGELWQAINKLLGVGGKRMRPYLTMLAYDLYGGENYQGALSVAAAQELLHLSMLIHDDIIDKDDIRYGIDNVTGTYIKKYAPHAAETDIRHYANGAALLAGDNMLSCAYMMILESSLVAEDKVYAAQLIGQSIFEVVGGELDDMESVFSSFEATDTLSIARYKTSGYSFVGPLLSGAWLARGEENELIHLKEFGICTGIAFQLADDVLGVFGDEKVTGKSVISDLKEGKRTYMMQYAHAHADPAQLAVLQTHLGDENMDEGAARAVREVVEATGARTAAESCIEEYADKARAALRRLTLSDEARQPLEDLIVKATKRDK